MIFLNLNDFTTPGYQFSTIHNVARGNRSELNLVRGKDINKNKKNKKPLFATTDAELVCVGLLVFSD